VEVVVAERVEVAGGVAMFRLESPVGNALPAWTPGAHIDIVLSDDLTRQYSLCGSSEDPSRWEIAVLREPDSRGGSAHMVDHVGVGDTLTTQGPRNHFPLEAAPAYRFVAGGIGITPLVPMIEAAERAGSDWRLLYGGRERASMALADELVGKYGDRVLLRPQDEFGLLDLVGYFADLPADALVYCCGPEPLLGAITDVSQDWPSGVLRLERFAPKEADAGAVDTEFEVELSQTGVTVLVPADRSVLDVAEEAGAFVISSCTEGTCGSCETTVLDGIPDHRDSVLDAEAREANDSMMICVSRCRGPKLVLDL
jgi:ferredoxin-NADP reductase